MEKTAFNNIEPGSNIRTHITALNHIIVTNLYII